MPKATCSRCGSSIERDLHPLASRVGFRSIRPIDVLHRNRRGAPGLRLPGVLRGLFFATAVVRCLLHHRNLRAVAGSRTVGALAAALASSALERDASAGSRVDHRANLWRSRVHRCHHFLVVTHRTMRLSPPPAPTRTDAQPHDAAAAHPRGRRSHRPAAHRRRAPRPRSRRPSRRWCRHRRGAAR